MLNKLCFIIISFYIIGCNFGSKNNTYSKAVYNPQQKLDTFNPIIKIDTQLVLKIETQKLPDSTLFINRQSLINYAKTLIGVPYVYGATNPKIGLDCSGFVTCVFNQINIKVPRSSVEFTNYGKTINVTDAIPGDLILFTGTNDSIRIVGHMGIITQNSDTLKFIHSTSGKAMGVTISPLSNYYKKRFVKVVRVFED